MKANLSSWVQAVVCKHRAAADAARVGRQAREDVLNLMHCSRLKAVQGAHADADADAEAEAGGVELAAAQHSSRPRYDE